MAQIQFHAATIALFLYITISFGEVRTAFLQSRTLQINASALATCKIGLPTSCQNERVNDLQRIQNVFKLGTSVLGVYKHLDMNASTLGGVYMNDPLNANWLRLYTTLIAKNLQLADKFMLDPSIGKEFKEIDQYKDLYEWFVAAQTTGLSQDDLQYFKFPSRDLPTPFTKIMTLCKWREDQYFTEQRLAGPNPMSIQRLSYSTGQPGILWRALSQQLNSTFPWRLTITEALNGDTPMSLESALHYGYVYVLLYPEYDGLTARPEPPEFPGRHIKKVVSPISIFVSKSSSYRPNRLIPVAIQMGHTKDSPVYTPDNPEEWLLAKQTVQVADFAYAQTIEHLLKTHMFMEPICASVHRHLHGLHPLHHILKFHCRGIFGANKFGSPYLLHPTNGTIEKLFAVGFKGAKEMLKRAFPKLHWDMTDPLKNIRLRGMDNTRKIPYYPYRDDGKVIYDVIRDLVKEYVALYYTTDVDIYDDYELQTLVMEIRDEIALPGFPILIQSKKELEDFLARLIWTTSAQHSAVNYPGSYYTAYTPSMPSKLYDDPRVTPGIFDVLNLPGKFFATIQATITMTLTGLHYDTLFDYGNQLGDDRAKILFAKYAQILNNTVKTQLEKRNKERFQAGHLTYPYLVPGYIANSIHT